METNNLKTFIGFAIKANKYRTGINSVQSLKSASVVIICKSMSENSIKQSIKIAKKLNSDIYVTNEILLSELTNKQDIKIIAITDYNLAQAIKNNSNEQLKFLD